MAEAAPARVWDLKDRKSGETRLYQQTELSIDGEVALFGLASRVVMDLDAKGFPWDRVSALLGSLDSDDGWDWAAVADLLRLASVEVPSAASEAVAIMFGLFPFDDDGKRVPEFDDEKAFIRRALSIALLVDITQLFVAQNDYQRLAAPFAAGFQKMTALGAQTPTQPPSPSASHEPSTSSPPPATGPRRTSVAGTAGGRSTGR